MKIKMLFVMSIEEEAAMLRMRRAALLTSNRSYLPYLLELLYFRYDMRMSRAGSAGPVDAMRFERKNNEKSVVGHRGGIQPLIKQKRIFWKGLIFRNSNQGL